MKVTTKILGEMKQNIDSLLQAVNRSKSQVLRWPFSLHSALVPSAPCFSLHLAMPARCRLLHEGLCSTGMKGRQDTVHHPEHGC